MHPECECCGNKKTDVRLRREMHINEWWCDDCYTEFEIIPRSECMDEAETQESLKAHNLNNIKG